MTKSVTFFYDYVSSASYLAWTQLPAMCVRHGAVLERRPILLGGLFKAVGNVSPLHVPAKFAWMIADQERFARRYGVPFVKSERFPFNTVAAMRGAIWARRLGRLPAWDEAFFKAGWGEGRDIGDLETVKAIAAAAGFDAEAFAAAIQTDEIKQALVDATAEAVAAGAFGAPTFVVDGVLHWGQDRLDWVEQALAAG